MVNEHYAEPKTEEILGSFLALLSIRQVQRAEGRKKVVKKTKEKSRQGQGQDIRKAFCKITKNIKKRMTRLAWS